MTSHVPRLNTDRPGKHVPIEKHLERHFVRFDQMPPYQLFDETGQPLPGIHGKAGACAIGSDGVEIGVDVIYMEPGSAFPLHTHEGDHILVALEGSGRVLIDGESHLFPAGSTFYISAEKPHGVATSEHDTVNPFVVLAFGHPHKALEAEDRMKFVERSLDQPWSSFFPGEG